MANYLRRIRILLVTWTASGNCLDPVALRAPMAARPPERPMGVLARDLLLAAALSVALYVVFGVVNARLLVGFTTPEVLLLEAGAIVLVAYLIARAVTNATNAMLRHRGLSPRGHAVRLFLNLLVATAAAFALIRLAGVSVESILLGAGFTGIVLGLASQTVLSNVFAGILIVFADPFRPGDRIGLVSAQYSLLGSTYPHEAIAPTYTGTVEDVGLTYTVVALDHGPSARIPNGIVIQAMVLLTGGSSLHRVRLTLPTTTPLADVEGSLPAIAREFPAPFPGAAPPRLEVADLAATTWDAVVVLWSDVRDANAVRDRVLRVLLPRIGRPGAAPAPGSPRP